MTICFYDAAQVEELLDYGGCIDVMRRAMIALSSGERAQPLRQIFTVGKNEMFGTMPGELAALSTFGAKLISVFADPERPGRSRHQGVVVAYDGATGAVSCIADAEPVTKIRTACATAAATDALARADAEVFAVFGTGVQAESHLRALPLVRPFREILLWGRSAERAREFAEQMSTALNRPITPVSDGREAAGRADVICTVTSSAEPVLLGDWVGPGTHINLVGSSYLGPVEVDTSLVAKARYVADYRPGVLAQAAELAVAREAGKIDDTHVICEIGDVFAGRVRARENNRQITIYKSLGHVVQDLAATAYLHGRTKVDRSRPLFPIADGGRSAPRGAVGRLAAARGPVHPIAFAAQAVLALGVEEAIRREPLAQYDHLAPFWRHRRGVALEDDLQRLSLVADVLRLDRLRPGAMRGARRNQGRDSQRQQNSLHALSPCLRPASAGRAALRGNAGQ